MKTKIITLLVLFAVTFNYAQRRRVADMYFKDYAYKKSAELYESIYKKGDSSKLVLSRLGDSYYFNTQTKEAEKWYKKLIKVHGDSILPEHKFRYAQVLKSNGNYRLSDSLMLHYLQLDSIQGHGLEKEVKNYDYLSYFLDFSGKNRVNVHNVATNTQYSDFGGFENNGTFYYASTEPNDQVKSKVYRWNDQPFLNLYSSPIIDNYFNQDVSQVEIVELLDKEILAKPINTKLHEATLTMTKDGKTMYFTRDNYDGRRVRRSNESAVLLKIYKATLEGDKWTNITELPFNSDDYSVGHPALSKDEKTLYFVSDMPGGYGHTDIYKIAINDDGTYGDPENLGSKINTIGREMFPFVGAKNILYFSSDGHMGMGALDIFEVSMSKDGFGKVKNLKAPFNSNLDDFGFVMNSEIRKGFFSSNREGGKGDDDIYSFSVYECLQTIEGTIADQNTGKPIPGITIKLVDKTGMVLASMITDESGVYRFEEVPCDTELSLFAEGEDYESTKTDVTTSDKVGGDTKTNMDMNPLIVENQIVINPIYFDFDKWNIREDAEYELEKIVSVMQNHPKMVIKLESHTDSRGTKAYNRLLSDRRAKSTRDYILSRGIAPERIESAIGYGEDQLLNHCNDANQKKCTEEEHQLNRRSYFYILSGKDNVKSSNEE